MAEQQEQNRSEAPTPFKLKRARERGVVARSIEIGFFGSLVALTGFTLLAGRTMISGLTQMMQLALGTGIDQANEPERSVALLATYAWPVMTPVILLGATVVAVVFLLELIQLRGLVFSAHPLKPDFSRLNPAKGLKRIFSMRMIKDTLKTVLKSAVYGIVTWLIIRFAINHYSEVAGDGARLAETMQLAGMRLIYAFIVVGLFFVLIDQMLVRQEFMKQMRMSRREVTRETKDREGDPRIKRKRKQLHAEYMKANQSKGHLPGSDLLVVNPEHFAVALRYDQDSMAAPQVTAKGRNRFAQQLKNEAFRLGIPMVRQPPLARALFRTAEPGAEIPTDHYAAVAALYLDLYRRRPARGSNDA